LIKNAITGCDISHLHLYLDLAAAPTTTRTCCQKNETRKTEIGLNSRRRLSRHLAYVRYRTESRRIKGHHGPIGFSL
jgi:hypothetical protein